MLSPAFVTTGCLISVSFKCNLYLQLQLSPAGHQHSPKRVTCAAFLISSCITHYSAEHQHVVSSNSIISSLCVCAVAPLFCRFARRSEPVWTRRAVTDVRPIPRLGRDACGRKVNSVMSTLSLSTQKFLTVCLRISLLPKGGLGCGFKLLNTRSD